MRKVVVTGAHGFIGGYVVRQLLDRGHGVLAFDRQQSSFASLHYPDAVDVFLGDVTSRRDVMEACAHADGCIHLAAVLGTQETIQDPRPAVMSNVLGGLNVLEACAHYSLPLTYIGVGNHWMNNPYSISKTTIERLCAMYRDYRALAVNVVRGVNAYGPWQRAAAPFAEGAVRKIMPAFVCRALSGMPIEVYGDGLQISDMVWVVDLARALVAALEKANAEEIFPDPIECGPAIHTTVRTVAELVAKTATEVTGKPEVPIISLPMRLGEEPGATVSADSHTLYRIGMHTNNLLPLPEGISRTVKWFHEKCGTWWNPPES